MQTICHRDRKRVHGKAHAQQCTVEKNKKLHSITECLLNLTKITVRQKQNPRSARVHVRSRVIFTNELHVLGVVLRTITHESRK